MLKIRLWRTGKKHQPLYRIVVTEHTAPVQGQYVEVLGNYNPITNGVIFDKEKALKWMNKGAKPSNRVAKIFTKAEIKHQAIIIKKFKAISKKELEKQKAEEEAKKEQERLAKEAKKTEFEKQVEEKKEEAVVEKTEIAEQGVEDREESKKQDKKEEEEKGENKKEKADNP